MPIDMGGTTPRPYYRPRVTSTPAPTYYNPQPAPDFASQFAYLDAQQQMLQAQSAQNATEKPKFTDYVSMGGGLDLASQNAQMMGLINYSHAKDAYTEAQKAYEAQRAQAASVPAPSGGSTYKASGGGGSGLGLSAYGVSKSGLASQKGKAKYGFQVPMWNALQAANRDMAKAGIGTFGITDGWRSYASQVSLKKRKGRLAATPGRSVHGIGMAADLRLSKRQYNWLKKNGARYGLVNLPGESWHWQLRANYKGDAGMTTADYDVPRKKGEAPFGLLPETYEAVSAANKAMAAAGLGTIGITSGYRSKAEQRELHKAQPATSAPAGQSTHELRVSVDIDGTPKQLAWLRENAYEFGLVPSSEPWHFQIHPDLVNRGGQQ